MHHSITEMLNRFYKKAVSENVEVFNFSPALHLSFDVTSANKTFSFFANNNVKFFEGEKIRKCTFAFGVMYAFCKIIG